MRPSYYAMPFDMVNELGKPALRFTESTTLIVYGFSGKDQKATKYTYKATASDLEKANTGQTMQVYNDIDSKQFYNPLVKDFNLDPHVLKPQDYMKSYELYEQVLTMTMQTQPAGSDNATEDSSSLLPMGDRRDDLEERPRRPM